MDSYLSVFCLFSTYLDTVFCNLALLHAFCSGLDSYLRLCGPSTYLLVTKRRPATWLKIGFPWLVAGLQSIGQLAVSDREKVRLHGDCRQSPSVQFTKQFEATCVITDPNFLIMRTSIAYALPLIACFCLTGLQMKRLRHLRYIPPATMRSLHMVRKTEEPPKHHALTPSPATLPREYASMRREVTAETLVVPTPLTTEARLPNSVTSETLDTCTSAGFTVVAITDLKKSADAVPTSVYDCPKHGLVALTSLPKSDYSTHNPPPSTSSGNRGVTVLTKKEPLSPKCPHNDELFFLDKNQFKYSDHGKPGCSRNPYHLVSQNTKNEVNMWFNVYRGEQLAVAINMVSCIVAVGVWSPLILSSLAHGLCQVGEPPILYRPQQVYYIPDADIYRQRFDPPSYCLIQVTVARLADFRWWSYASTGLLLPIVLLLMDTRLRRSCWQSLGFEWASKRRKLQRQRGSIPMESLNAPDKEAIDTTIEEENSVEPHFARINSKIIGRQFPSVNLV